MGFIDTGSIYAPVQKIDPGLDGKSGTADDGQSLTVYNLTNPGKEFKLFTNPANAFRDYNGVPVDRHQAVLEQLAGVACPTPGRSTDGTVNNIGGTNAAAARRTSRASARPAPSPTRTTPSTSMVRSTFDYTQPGQAGWHLPRAGVRRLQRQRASTGTRPGSPGDGPATIRGLDQGNETVRIEPSGTRRTDPINNVDFRVEKTFPIGASDRQVGVYLDIFNINNQGVIDNGMRTGVIDSSGIDVRQPEHLDQPAPRAARVPVHVLDGDWG